MRWIAEEPKSFNESCMIFTVSQVFAVLCRVALVYVAPFVCYSARRSNGISCVIHYGPGVFGARLDTAGRLCAPQGGELWGKMVGNDS